MQCMVLVPTIFWCRLYIRVQVVYIIKHRLAACWLPFHPGIFGTGWDQKVQDVHGTLCGTVKSVQSLKLAVLVYELFMRRQ